MNNPPDYRRLTSDYIAAFGSRDIEAVCALASDDFVLEDPAGRFSGKAAREYVAKIFSENPVIEFKARQILVDGTVSVIEFDLKLGSTCLVGTDVIEWHGEKIMALRAYLREAR